LPPYHSSIRRRSDGAGEHALVADLYPPENGHCRSASSGQSIGGWVLGHLYGGIMVQFMSWPYLFWINLPVVSGLLHHVVGVDGLPRMDVKGGIDWIGVTSLARRWFCSISVLARRNSGSKDQTALPSPHRLYWVAGAAVVFRRLPGFSAARARSHSRLAHLLEPQLIGGERRQSAGRLLHHGGACQRSHLHQRCRRRGHDEGALVNGIPALRLYRADGARAIPGGWLSERLGYRSSVVSVDHGHRSASGMSLWKVEWPLKPSPS